MCSESEKIGLEKCWICLKVASTVWYLSLVDPEGAVESMPAIQTNTLRQIAPFLSELIYQIKVQWYGS